MKHPYLRLATIAYIALAAPQLKATEYSVSSPDGQLTATIDNNSGKTTLSISRDGRQLILPSEIALIRQNSVSWKKSGKATIKKNLREVAEAPFYRQNKIDETYNQLSLPLGDGTMIEIRAFDSGIAYRFVTNGKKHEIILDETADIRFAEDPTLYLPFSTNPKNPTAMAFQARYAESKASEADDQLAFLPVTADFGNDVKVTILESDLEAYPGMFVRPAKSEKALKAEFAKYPATTDFYPWRMQEYVTSTEDYIAKTEGKRTYPWRIFAVTTDDRQMPVNNLVYALASPSRMDTMLLNEIKPGKSAWEWWNDWGLSGVDFEAGINTETYKKYIDFAAKSGLQYMILDEGWYDPKSGDMLTVVPEIDLSELIRYADSKGIKLVLWTVFNVLDKQLEEACKKYKDMGIAGFKVDFLDRQDQTAVEMTYRIADACSKYGLALDLHGFYPPTGINRTYPNIINYESVFGMEEMKWSEPDVDMMHYDVTMPYIRMMAGPIDYTPGAMRNASRSDWKAMYSNPYSQGTRAHQLATYVVIDSPFTMLADSPSAYEGEDDAVDFMANVPAVPESTEVLQGKLGEYIVTARKTADGVWVGGMTDWNPRDIDFDFSFLPDGNYEVMMISDGKNAHKVATDYKKETFIVAPDSNRRIHLAPGGGFVMRIKKI